MTGVEMIALARLRHAEKGYGAEHDDKHEGGELAIVAAQVIVGGGLDVWNIQSNHRLDRKQQLAIAGSLIAAEIDRLQRIEDRMPRLKESK